MQISLHNHAQFALLFEREILDYRKSFVKLFRESIVPVVSQNHPLARLKEVSLPDLE